MMMVCPDCSIYGDIGQYAPQVGKSKDKKDRRRDRLPEREKDEIVTVREEGIEIGTTEIEIVTETEGTVTENTEIGNVTEGNDTENRIERGTEKGNEKRSYFEKPSEEDFRDKSTDSAKELVKTINDRFKSYADMEDEKQKASEKAEKDRLKKLQSKMEIDSYAECYPGMVEAFDAIDESDDEVDYTKMDQGNKKGPIGRWDFDTQEEYSDYMSNKEALPKAAFQYGVKMADGRRTRRTGPKDEKAKLDRELQQINRIIQKRKVAEPGDGEKRIKY